MNYIDFLRQGSSIHIKKKNKGKFTDYCGGHVTEECIERGKHSSNPTTRKRATFAANSRKWKHEVGGIVSAKDGISTKKVWYDSRTLPEDIYKNDTTDNTTGSNSFDRMFSWYDSRPEREYEAEQENETPTITWKDVIVNNPVPYESSTVMTSSSTTPKQASTTSKQSSKYEGLSEDLVTLLNMFEQEGIKVRVTSGYRPGAITSSGEPSKHASGTAIDIVPVDGDFAKLATAIKLNPSIRYFMTSKGLGLVDETTPEMMKKTHATGPHFHIGPDKLGQRFWS